MPKRMVLVGWVAVLVVKNGRAFALAIRAESSAAAMPVLVSPILLALAILLLEATAEAGLRLRAGFGK